ncbi:hypothetical protein [Roseicyclus elongatus]|nr:hypothetical protein [Roseibacterium elongatum]
MVTQTAERRPTPIPRDRLDKIEAFMAIGANVTVIVTLIIAVLSYREQVNQAKREAAFQFVAAFNDGALLDAQRRFGAEMARVDIRGLRDVTVPRETMATIIDQMVDTSSSPNTLQQDIISIIGYFDSAQVCIDSDTCDGAIILGNLTEIGGRYACLLLPYSDLISRDSLFDGLGDGLRRLIDYETRC